MSERTEERRTIKLVDPGYQRSRTEMDEEIDFRDLVEGKSLEDSAYGVVRPVNVRYVKRPQSA